MVHVQQESSEQAIEFRQREPWLSANACATRDVAVQLAQEHFIDGREEAFDAATASVFAGD